MEIAYEESGEKKAEDFVSMADIGWEDLGIDIEDDHAALKASDDSSLKYIICSHSMVEQNGDCLGKIRMDHLQSVARVIITGAMRTIALKLATTW